MMVFISNGKTTCFGLRLTKARKMMMRSQHHHAV